MCAFVTFKTVKGSEEAKKLLTTRDRHGNLPQLFGDRVRCQRADNPSDIRWRNKEVRSTTLVLRNLLFALVVLTVLYLTYGQLFFPMLKKGQAEVDILPTVEECDSLGR